MRLPAKEKDILAFGQQTAKQCLASLPQRINQYALWRNYLFAGTEDATRPSIYNKCGPHIDRLSSFLYSPTDVRFLAEFGRRAGKAWKDRAQYISELLSEEFHGTGSDLIFGEGVPWALTYGSAFMKVFWHPKKGVDTFLVMPSQMGVWREDVNGLDRQEAITNISYISRKDLWRRVQNHSNRREIMEAAQRQISDRSEDETSTMLHQIIIGGTYPVQQGTPTGTKGQVDIFNIAPAAQFPPEVVEDIVKFNEVWVLDDEREDWTTIQFLDPDILIEPSGQKRNLFLPKRQPFQMIQPNSMHGYFWGRSELSDLWRLQDVITQSLDDIHHITRLRAHPPRAFIGFSGISEESKAAMGALDGILVETTPNAKIENLAPEMPQDSYTNLEKNIGFFDDVAGFSPLMQGQGEPGVRAGMHAQTLQRSASARMRDRALVVERQLSEFGDLFLELLAAKDEGAIVQGLTEEEAALAQKQGVEPGWLLSQMPEERRVVVDSHSSSPAFSIDHRQEAFGLAKAGAVTPEGLLDLVNPPQKDRLKAQLKEKQAAEAQMIKEHPELLTKGKKKR